MGCFSVLAHIDVEAMNWILGVVLVILAIGLARTVYGFCRIMMKNYGIRPEVTDQGADVVLVLGGEPYREEFAAEILRDRHELVAIMSSGCYALQDEVFNGVRDRVIVDRTAVDTVSNFTSLADELQTREARRILVITSDYHMRRSKAVGLLILGSLGMQIGFTVARRTSERRGSPSNGEESLQRTVRDVLRALVWIAFRVDGTMISSMLQTIRSPNMSCLL